MLEIGAPKPEKAAEHVRDADPGNFEELVLEASLKKPVIVDFWAPWCGPCKQMTPLLEKAVALAGGAVDLVKINADKYPELAEVFRVQSVPTVYAFFNGQPVDGFMGARGEADIGAFIDRLLRHCGAAMPPAEAEGAQGAAKLMEEAQAHFAQGQYTDAMAKYSTVLDIDEKNMEALAGIGWCFVAEKDAEALAEFISQLTPGQKTDEKLRGLVFLFEKTQEAKALENANALQTAVEKNPKDLQARYGLALCKIAACDLEGAIGLLVDIARLNREWEEQKARRLLLELFEAMGPQHPLTAQGRRRLSAVLFA